MKRDRKDAPTATSRGRRLALVLCGSLLGLILVEAGLRSAGALVLARRERHNPPAAADDGTYRILCLGESTTALGGARSYPRQLQHELQRLRPDLRFSVVNKGAPARDTDYILSRLEENLDAYDPHVVVTMMGVNDTGTTVPFAATSNSALLRFLANMRTVKVAKLAWLQALAFAGASSGGGGSATGHASRPSTGRDPQAANLLARAAQAKVAGDVAAARTLAEEARRLDPTDPAVLHAVVAYGALAGRWDDSRAALEEARAAGADDSQIRALLVGTYFHLANERAAQGRLEEAEVLFGRAMEIDPGARAGALAQLALFHRTHGDRRRAEQLARRARALRTSEYNPKTQRNYLALKRILDARGIPLVAVQYPRRELEPLRRMLAGRTGVHFVDAERPFERALADASWGEYFTDAFAGDFGHMTPRGNALLAATVAPVVLRALGQHDGAPASRRAGLRTVRGGD